MEQALTVGDKGMNLGISMAIYGTKIHKASGLSSTVLLSNTPKVTVSATENSGR